MATMTRQGQRWRSMIARTYAHMDGAWQSGVASWDSKAQLCAQVETHKRFVMMMAVVVVVVVVCWV